MGVMNGAGVHVLVDSGATHNVIDINVAHSIRLQEQRINTTILVGSGNEVSCHAASFAMPLRIDNDIDAYLHDIGNDVDVILGTPWLASLGSVVWDFTNMELQYVCNRRPHIFHAPLRRQVSTTVLALPAPLPIVRAGRTSPPPRPRNVMNRAHRARLPNALDPLMTPTTSSSPTYTRLFGNGESFTPSP
jgi:hypothetical protein